MCVYALIARIRTQFSIHLQYYTKTKTMSRSKFHFPNSVASCHSERQRGNPAVRRNLIGCGCPTTSSFRATARESSQQAYFAPLDCHVTTFVAPRNDKMVGTPTPDCHVERSRNISWKGSDVNCSKNVCLVGAPVAQAENSNGAEATAIAPNVIPRSKATWESPKKKRKHSGDCHFGCLFFLYKS